MNHFDALNMICLTCAIGHNLIPFNSSCFSIFQKNILTECLTVVFLSSILNVISFRSTCTNSKHSPSNRNTPNEEQAEGKPTPTDLPPDALPALEGAPDPNTFTNESQQDKEKVKKTKNNKEGKVENDSGNVQESTPPAGSQENAATELNNKKHSFRSQYSRLPANLPMRSTACNLL